MAFSEEIKMRAMVACGRRCCICQKFCGNNMEVHHIEARADGGDDSFENAIPLCFDCHAEVRQYDPRHPKGIKFSVKELRAHRDNWYSKMKNVSPLPSTHKSQPQTIQMRRVTTGKELFSYALGAFGMEYNHDEPQTTEEAKMIGDFLQGVEDIMDADDFLEPMDRVTAAFGWNEVLEDLDKCGFYVFAAKGIRKVQENQNSSNGFPVLIIQILRKTNPRIVKKES